MLYPRERREAPAVQFSQERHGQLKATLTAKLLQLMGAVRVDLT